MHGACANTNPFHADEPEQSLSAGRPFGAPLPPGKPRGLQFKDFRQRVNND